MTEKSVDVKSKGSGEKRSTVQLKRSTKSSEKSKSANKLIVLNLQIRFQAKTISNSFTFHFRCRNEDPSIDGGWINNNTE